MIAGIAEHLLVRGDARRIPLRDGCVQCVVTSPPYFGLRDYGASGQIGLEARPEDYVAAMVAVFREVRRVLRSDGCVWLNIGDSHSAVGKSGGGAQGKRWEVAGADHVGPKGGKWRPAPKGLGEKQLLGIPWRVALALQSDGWVLRSAAPWIKRNPMPESVGDRPSTAHEHIFLLAKSPAYFYDLDAVRRPALQPQGQAQTAGRQVKQEALGRQIGSGSLGTNYGDAGRNLRTSDLFFDSLDERIAEQRFYLRHLEAVRRKGGMLTDEDGDPLAFVVNTTAFRGAHYAVFPPRLIEPMIRASTSQAGCCGNCGTPWVRIVESERIASAAPSGMREIGRWAEKQESDIGGRVLRKSIGWQPSCPCPPSDPVGCLVLDPFNGAGTAGVVATGLGRRYVGMDLSAAYLGMAARRIARPDAAIAPPVSADDRPLFQLGIE